MIEKYQSKKTLLQMLEHFFLTFSIFFIVSVIFSELDWGLYIDNELAYLIPVLLFALNDLIIFIFSLLIIILIEQKRKKEFKELTQIIILESVSLVYNAFVFILIIAPKFEIEIFNATGVVSALAIATLIKLLIILLMRRENR